MLFLGTYTAWFVLVYLLSDLDMNVVPWYLYCLVRTGILIV